MKQINTIHLTILTFSAICGRNKAISPSDMRKKILFLEMIDIKVMADKFYMHTYLTLTLFLLFNIVCESNGFCVFV